MEIKGYTLINQEKVDRALNGTQKTDGSFIGGVGNGAYFEGGVWKRNGDELPEKEVASLEDNLLAEYDKLGGLIKRGDDKLKTGSFFDFKGKKPHVKPQIVFIFRVNGKFVEVPDGIELPGEVRAAKILEKVAQDADEDDSEEEKVEEKKSKKKSK